MEQEKADPSSHLYLEKNFDPNTLTKPQLRSILLSNNVIDFPPPTAKKEILIELFNKHIKSKREEILKSHAKIRPSSNEILFLDDQSRPSPNKSKLKEKSRDKRMRSQSKTPPKEKGEKKKISTLSKSRSRSRSKTPSKSPLKKMTMTIDSTPTKAIKSPSSSFSLLLNSPLLNLSKSLPIYSDSPRTITNKLQSRLGYIEKAWKSLDKDSSSSTKSSIQSLSPSHSSSQSTLKWKIINFILQLFVISVSILAAFYIRYQWIYPYPYCLTGQVMTNQKCLPCPQHGKCSLGQLISCDQGYSKRKCIFSLGHYCQPDWKKIKAADLMKRHILNILNDHQANIICNNKKEQKEDEKRNRGLAEESIKNILKEKKKEQWDLDLFKIAMAELAKNPEKAIKTGDEWRVTRVKLGIPCRIKLRIQNFFYQYKYYLIAFSIMLLLSIISIWKWRKNRRFEDKSRELYHAVLQILAEQDAIHQRDPTHPSTLSIHQLRDALIAANHQMIIKEHLDPYKLWNRVSFMIRENTNVRESIMMIRGEEHGIWEWIGIDVFKKLN